ncbi:MAG: HEAT repeat domain-containing protein [Acidobacteriota bacterium]|nr:HEAT repeat domain-containing protein [Acidobacteriota bacterium]
MSVNDAEVRRWLDMMPFPDNPKQSLQPGARLAGSWEGWLAAGKEMAGMEEALGRMLEGEKDAVTRSRAALALGSLGGAASVNVLINALASDVPLVQMEAASALGRIGDSEALEPLSRALQSPDSNVRANAGMALGRLGGEKARDYLKRASRDEDPFVRAAVEEALRGMSK